MSNTIHEAQPKKATNGADTSATEAIAAKAEQIRDDAGEAIEQSVEAATAQLQTASQEFRTAVRKNPAMAVGVAVGAGVLLGLALRGRS